MNILGEYIARTGASQKKIAQDAGCSRAAISMIAAGLRRPSPGLALRIEKATGGAVRAAELIFGQDLKADDQDAA